MKAVMMDNDLGGVVHVGKNELRLSFMNGVKHIVRVNTKELLHRLETKSDEFLETDEYSIEPMYRDCEGALVTIISVTTKQDEDMATVFLCDLREALKMIERPDLVY